MSWYRMVDVRIHGDAKFLNLSPEQPSGRALFKHLLICEENGPLPGVVRAGAASLAEALEWSPEGLRERFGELFREGLAEADWKARLVFLPNGIKYNPPNNPNVVAGWSKHWDALPEGPLKARIWERFHAFFVEDARRREEEISRGERDKKSDPSMLLKAFLAAMPPPSVNGSKTVPGTVTETVLPTVPERVGGRSAGARARLPEPEQNTETEGRRTKERGDARGGGAESEGEKTGAPPPDPRVARASKANGAESTPGEEQLEALADALWTAHPSGVRGGTRVATQRALLELLTAGRIWPDESPPDPSPPAGFGLSFSELRARHEAWLAVWRPRGTVPPMNLPRRWLGRDGDGGGLDFLDAPPSQEGKAPPKAKEWSPGVNAQRLENARAKMFRRPARNLAEEKREPS